MHTSREKKDSDVQPNAENAARLAADVGQKTKLDYLDLKEEWDEFIQNKRVDSESTLFNVNVRIKSLDPMAEIALAKVMETYNTKEEEVRQKITQKGWASELDRVIKRINSLRMSENKRVILAKVYPSLLDRVFSCNDTDEKVKDERGMTDEILFELEKKDGPLDIFSKEIVAIVGIKNRIDFTKDNILRDLIASQVRVGL